MGRHSPAPTPPPPPPPMWRIPDLPDYPDYPDVQELPEERMDPVVILTVVGMLCFTVILVAMAVSGGSEAIGQVACTLLVAGAWLTYKRFTR